MTTDTAAIAATNGGRTAGPERFYASNRLVVIRAELPDISDSLAEAFDAVTWPNYDGWGNGLGEGGGVAVSDNLPALMAMDPCVDSLFTTLWAIIYMRLAVSPGTRAASLLLNIRQFSTDSRGLWDAELWDAEGCL